LTVESEIEQYYDARSKTFDDIFDVLYYRIHDLITWKYIDPYIPTDPESLVLDAGGGTGRWSIRIARKGCEVVLMDISKELFMEKKYPEDLYEKILQIELALCEKQDAMALAGILQAIAYKPP